MRELWVRLKNHSSLRKDLTAVIAQAAEIAVKEMGLEGRFAELERARLAKLAAEWIEVEEKRAPFTVLFTEQQRDLDVAGLQFQSRIDRMDVLEDGSHVLIDYKSARFLGIRQWDGPRPDDPQLPLYAVAAPEKLGAVVFARLRPGEMRFIGLSRKPQLLPQVNAATDWTALLRAWKKDADALGAAFAAGEAPVDPKEELKTCRRCDLQTLCRVYEKLSGLAGEDAG
jgi:RecB family exonuclease